MRRVKCLKALVVGKKGKKKFFSVVKIFVIALVIARTANGEGFCLFEEMPKSSTLACLFSWDLVIGAACVCSELPEMLESAGQAFWPVR